MVPLVCSTICAGNQRDGHLFMRCSESLQPCVCQNGCTSHGNTQYGRSCVLFYEMMLILGGGIIFRCMKTDEMLLEQINGIE